MANRKEVAEQNKQAEQANTQAEQANTDAQTNEVSADTNTENNQEQTQAPVENKNDEKVNEAAAENNAPAVITESKNTHVIVCLKHPQGIKFKLPNNRSVVINGNAAHLRGNRAPILPQGGYGMTTINKDDWEYIKKTYSSMNIFKSGLIFANADTASVKSQAKEHDEIKSGFEPIDISKEKKIDALKKVKNYKKDE